jgi:glutamate--cysteine ligase catalytic subunit
MVIFDGKIEVDNSKNLNHYENISSTNWNSVRFKVPPTFDGPIGWRVEFRTMEV